MRETANTRGWVALVRHGETAGNAGRVVQVPETPLNERGLAQASRLAERLAREGPSIERIVSSDLQRAAMTAEVLAARLGAPIAFDPLLQERNFGALRGTAYADLETDLFAPGYEPPEGESWEIFHERVSLAWQAVVEHANRCERGALLVVTHGLVCGALVQRELAHTSSRGVGAFGNTALTLLRTAEPAGRSWQVERFACVAHLEGAADEASANDADAIVGL